MPLFPNYKRIILKLSGEVFQGSRDAGIDFDVAGNIAQQIKEIVDMHIQVGVVVGGGNIFRGAAGAQAGLNRATGDYMGMLATVINALALQNSLEKQGVVTRVQTAIEAQKIAEPYIRRRAIRHLEKGRVVILAGGTGNPYFTTDTAAALRATELCADIILKATKVDGVYSSDPISDPTATRYDYLDHIDVIKKGLKVMDATAITLCMEQKIPIIVFDLTVYGNIKRVISGEKIGTTVGGRQ